MASFTKEQEQKFVEYLNRKGVPKLMDEMLEETCSNMVPDPQSHLSAWLAKHERHPYPTEGACAADKSEGGTKTVLIRDIAGNHPDLKADGKYEIKAMGTSGLRLKQGLYNRPGFLEQFAQGVAEFFAKDHQKALRAKQDFQGHADLVIVGGDPRRGNRERIDMICRCLVGNGLRVLVAKDYIASTPAISHAIRHERAAGGIILTASHNPVLDAGIKINLDEGQPALEDTVQKVFDHQKAADSWTAIGDIGAARYEGLVREIDTVRLYADLLDSIFDFRSMAEKLQAEQGFRAALDCMHGAAGPYAREVFVNRLQLKEGEQGQVSFVREVPRSDLGGEDAHPEPDFDWVEELILKNNSREYNIVAAWDSDVDRRLDGGKGFFVESADEFCIFANAIKDGIIKLHDLPQFAGKAMYFCRSTVTANAIDLMKSDLEKSLEKPPEIVETATGFKYIAELGNWGVEESNGVGNPWLREKDGIFSTVFLLKVTLETKKSPQELMEGIWTDYGRVYFTRGEVSSAEDTEGRHTLSEILNAAVTASAKPAEEGEEEETLYGTLKIEKAERWIYRSIVDRAADKDPDAWVLTMSEGNVIKVRFSGTGSAGYCLRVYCSKFSQDFRHDKQSITQPMKDAFNDFLRKNGWNGPEACKFTDANQPEPYPKG